MKIVPIGNRLVVKVSKRNQTTKSGIIVHQEAKDEQTLGQVIALGNGYGEEKDLLQSLKIGDTVLFSSYSGQEIKDEENEDFTYKVIEMKNVSAIIIK